MRRVMMGAGLFTMVAACAPFTVGPISEEPAVDLERVDRAERAASEVTLVILTAEAVELFTTHVHAETVDSDDDIDVDEDDEDDEEDQRPVDDLTVGYKDDAERRVLLRFSLDALPAGANITSASLELTSADSALEPVEFIVGALDSAWRIDKVTWEDQPSVEQDTATAAMIEDDAVTDRFDLTTTVQAWVKGDLLNNGLGLKALPEDHDVWKSYHSLESGKITAGPRLVIKYHLGP